MSRLFATLADMAMHHTETLEINITLTSARLGKLSRRSSGEQAHDTLTAAQFLAWGS
jgi:hypothetical protein